MTEAVVAALVGLLVGGVAGWLIRGPGSSEPPPPEKESVDLSPLLDALRKGEVPGEEAVTSADPAIRELLETLSSEWAPRGEGGQDVEKVVKRALGRLAIYLRNRVESPLLEGLEEGGQALEDGADAALGAVEDLEFFLEASETAPDLAPMELREVVDEVLEEFRDQSEVAVELSVDSDRIPVRVNAERLKDAVFLILHNAAEFGEGESVRVTLRREGNRAIIRIQDQGPGFSSEALMNALDPFYSTSPEGLGLGLPHALNSVRAQGGQILLRNLPEGGGEVEVLLPAID